MLSTRMKLHQIFMTFLQDAEELMGLAPEKVFAQMDEFSSQESWLWKAGYQFFFWCQGNLNLLLFYSNKHYNWCIFFFNFLIGS